MARTTMRRLEPRAAVVAMGLWLGGVGVAAQPSSVDPVVLVRVSDADLRPSTEVDDAGTLHLTPRLARTMGIRFANRLCDPAGSAIPT